MELSTDLGRRASPLRDVASFTNNRIADSVTDMHSRLFQQDFDLCVKLRQGERSSLFEGPGVCVDCRCGVAGGRGGERLGIQVALMNTAADNSYRDPHNMQHLSDCKNKFLHYMILVSLI